MLYLYESSKMNQYWICFIPTFFSIFILEDEKYSAASSKFRIVCLVLSFYEHYVKDIYLLLKILAYLMIILGMHSHLKMKNYPSIFHRKTLIHDTPKWEINRYKVILIEPIIMMAPVFFDFDGCVSSCLL